MARRRFSASDSRLLLLLLLVAEDTEDDDDADIIAPVSVTAGADDDAGAAEVLPLRLILVDAPSSLSLLLALGVASWTVVDATDAPPPPLSDDAAVPDVTIARSLRLRLILSCKREDAQPPAPLTEIVDDEGADATDNDDDE
jgi:hypothetical protein